MKPVPLLLFFAVVFVVGSALIGKLTTLLLFVVTGLVKLNSVIETDNKKIERELKANEYMPLGWRQ